MNPMDTVKERIKEVMDRIPAGLSDEQKFTYFYLMGVIDHIETIKMEGK